MTYEDLARLLTRTEQVGPFLLRYGPYFAAPERLYRGYREHQALHAFYREGFEAAKSRLPELFGERGPAKVTALVLHLPDSEHGAENMPFTTRWIGGLLIALPNRSGERSLEEVRDLARSTAVHEACHAFQFSIRRYWRAWHWFMEATAVFAECYVYEKDGGRVCSDFFKPWLDDPEVPLDAAEYEAGMFARWLHRTLPGTNPVGRIWTESGMPDTPFGMLEKLVAPIETLFPEYARDSYFIVPEKYPCGYPELAKWWGLRETRDTVELPRESGRVVKGRIDHLACNYVRVSVGESVRAIRCELATDGISAQIAAYNHDGTRGGTAEIGPVGELAVGNPRPDHYVVTLANGHRTQNEVRYELTVRGE